MATVNPIVCPKFNLAATETSAASFNALNNSAGVAIAYRADQKMLLMLKATTAGTATIQRGTALQGVADLEVEVAADSTAYLAVESGAYLQADGTVIIKGPATIGVCAVVLP